MFQVENLPEFFFVGPFWAGLLEKRRFVNQPDRPSTLSDASDLGDATGLRA